MKRFAITSMAVVTLMACVSSHVSAQTRSSSSRVPSRSNFQDRQFRSPINPNQWFPPAARVTSNRTSIVDSGNGELNRIRVSNRGRSRRGNINEIVGSGNGFENRITITNGSRFSRGRRVRGTGVNRNIVTDSGNGEGNRITIRNGGRRSFSRGRNVNSVIGSGNGVGNVISISNR